MLIPEILEGSCVSPLSLGNLLSPGMFSSGGLLRKRGASTGWASIHGSRQTPLPRGLRNPSIEGDFCEANALADLRIGSVVLRRRRKTTKDTDMDTNGMLPVDIALPHITQQTASDNPAVRASWPSRVDVRYFFSFFYC